MAAPSPTPQRTVRITFRAVVTPKDAETLGTGRSVNILKVVKVATEEKGVNIFTLTLERKN